MPESLIGKGEFFALIVKGESMVDVGVYPEDYVIVRRQQTAEEKAWVESLSLEDLYYLCRIPDRQRNQ